MATPSFNKSIKREEVDNNASFSTSAFTANTGSNRFLEVTFLVGALTPSPPSQVYWGTSQLTKRADTRVQENSNLSKWYLIESNFPSGQTGSISAAFPGSQDEIAGMGVIYNDVDQTTPYRNTTITSATAIVSNSAQIAVSSNVDDLVTNSIYAFHSGGGQIINITVSGSGTSREEIDSLGGGGYEGGAIGDIPGATSVLTGWTITTVSDTPNVWVMFADSIKGAAGSGETPTISATHFRARNDNGSETTDTWIASEDSNITFPLDTNVRFRYQIDSSGDPSSKSFRLEYKITSASSWSVVGNHIVSATASHGVNGAAGYSAANGIVTNPTYPTGITTNSALVLFVGQKALSANQGNIITPTGWTIQSSILSAGGYGTSLAADTGNTNLFAYTKDVVSGTETGTLTVSASGNTNVVWAEIIRVESDMASTWSFSATTGSDITAGNPQITFASDPGIQLGDYVIAAMCIPTDVTTPTQFTASVFAQAGVNYGIPVEIDEPDSGNGNDIGGLISYVIVSGGLSTGVPVFSATAAGTTTNVRGPAILLRCRPIPIQYPIELAASSNISAGGQPTTFQLTVPVGKTSSNFTTGRIWDDENGSDSIDILSAGYTEVEWSIKALASQGASNTQQYNLRVTDAGTQLNSYNTSAIWTIGALATNATINIGLLSGTYSLPIISRNMSYSVPLLSGTYRILEESNLYISASSVVAVAPLSGTFSIPSIVGNQPVSISPSPISATYSILSPTIKGDAIISVGLLNSTFSLSNISLIGNVTISPSPISATYSILSPTIKGDANLQANPISATFNISASTSTGSIIQVPILSANISLQTPSVGSSSNVSIQVSPLNGTHSLQSPIIQGNSNISLGLLNGTFSNNNISIVGNSNIQVPILSGNISLQNSTLQGSSVISINPISSSYSILNPDILRSSIIQISPLNAAYSFQTPSLEVGGSKTIQVSPLNVVYNIPSIQINTNSIISVPSLAASYSLQNLNIKGDTNILSPILSANISLQTPSVGSSSNVNIQVETLSASYSFRSLNIVGNSIIPVNILSGNSSLLTPTIQNGSSVTISVGTLDATYSIPNNNIQGDCSINVNPISGNYTLQSPSLQVQGGITISVGVLNCSYSFPSPNIVGNSNIQVNPLTASHILQTPNPKTGVTIGVNPLNGIINIISPTLRYDKNISVGVLNGNYSIWSLVFNSGNRIKKLRRQEGY
jgi:hypothetical protein